MSLHGRGKQAKRNLTYRLRGGALTHNPFKNVLFKIRRVAERVFHLH